ncbi:MAG: penicillin-binding protein 2 [Parcubacteria group bacterium]|nr:penicillin-binding protein 2 [Parcubacteria group bacterium]
MAHNPFAATAKDSAIRDSRLPAFPFEVDGDIMAADSYRKRSGTAGSFGKSIRFSALAAVLFFGGLFSRLYYLQMVRGEEYYGAAEGNRIRSTELLPPRGVIMDSKARRLGYNIPDFALIVTPADLPATQEEEDAIFESIGQTLGIDAFDLVERFASVPRTSRTAVEIMRGIPQEDAVVLTRSSSGWSGVSITPIQQRTYAIDEPFSHVLGYTGNVSPDDYAYVSEEGYSLVEHVGKAGVEKAYQTELRGVPGFKLVEVDSRGQAGRELETKGAVSGSNVYLHIDAALQQIAWDALSESIAESQSPGGSVVALDPESGAVRALVSYPSFSSKEFAGGIAPDAYQELLADPRTPLLNRAVSGEYPSGSTIKLVIGTAGLEEGVVSRYTTVRSSGGIRINEYWYPDWRYGGHGTTDMVHALADSVNTYFYAVGGGYGDIEGLGVERIVAYGARFGLGFATGIDLPSERSGFLPSKEWKEAVKGERWYLGDTYHLAIGQGDILVTPLQVANFTAAIANGGTLYAPRIVDRIGQEYAESEPFSPVILNSRVAARENIRIIQEGLREAVTAGTARSLSGLPAPVAGKTGTAQFQSDKKPHAWFTGYGPYGEDPELVVTVLVEEGEGGDLAATPVAKKIFEWYFGER